MGACEEHAAIMQTILKAAGVENVVTLRSDSPHAFVVVNLAPGADPDLPWTWGADTLIPDTWIGDQFNPEKAWRSRYIFGNGKYFVSSGKERLTTREKFWQFLDRSEDFLRQHCQEYKRLYEQTIKNNTYPVDKKQGWRIFQSKGKLPR